MDEKKVEILRDNGYEVENDIFKFLNLTPDEENVIRDRLLKANLEWITDK